MCKVSRKCRTVSKRGRKGARDVNVVFAQGLREAVTVEVRLQSGPQDINKRYRNLRDLPGPLCGI